jgi:hypothetical protein
MVKTSAEAWIEEGQLLNSRTILCTLLKDRFGSLPEALANQINATTDLERLQQAVRQVLRLQKLEDLQL